MTAKTSEPAVVIRLMRLPHALGLPLPEYQTPGSAGLDLMAAFSDDFQFTLKNGERTLVPTGLSLQIPLGFEVQIRSRSGLALKHGISVLNSPGTIDSDYRGEIKILLINHGTEPFLISRGLRIAQMVVAPVIQVWLAMVEQLDDSERGEGGFGSTGRG